jgi:hypothetical protein
MLSSVLARILVQGSSMALDRAATMLSSPLLGDGLLVRVMQGVRATQRIMDALKSRRRPTLGRGAEQSFRMLLTPSDRL